VGLLSSAGPAEVLLTFGCCALPGEVKKGRYVYYDCSGYKEKCPERNVREEKLKAAFTIELRHFALAVGAQAVVPIVSGMEDTIRIRELASRAAELFEKQPTDEKRRLLNCVLKGAFWPQGQPAGDFRQPFDMLAKTALSNSASDSMENPIEASKGEKKSWLPDMDSNHDSRLQRPLSYHWTIGEEEG
jgi:hypothetical protein